MIQIEGTNFEYFDQGGSAFIFADQDTGRAVKLFKTRGIPREFIKTTYWSEVKAYNLVQRSPALIEMVPRFYGHRKVTKIIGRTTTICRASFIWISPTKSTLSQGRPSRSGSKHRKMFVTRWPPFSARSASSTTLTLA